VIVEKMELLPGKAAGVAFTAGDPAPPPPTVTGYVVALTGKAATPEPNGLTV
jgi:hypothetical protein